MVDILTLRLDPTSQQRFDDLRKRYFPPERNYIPAHLTLFHALPSEERIAARLALVAHGRNSFPVRVTGLLSLGKGVAYKLASTDLQVLHTELSTSFTQDLIPQDRQPFRPHVVVQNKTTPDAARQLLQHLQQEFLPWVVTADGLDLWHYLGGPWQHVQTFRFQNASPTV